MAKSTQSTNIQSRNFFNLKVFSSKSYHSFLLFRKKKNKKKLFGYGRSETSVSVLQNIQNCGHAVSTVCTVSMLSVLSALLALRSLSLAIMDRMGIFSLRGKLARKEKNREEKGFKVQGSKVQGSKVQSERKDIYNFILEKRKKKNAHTHTLSNF